MTSLSFAAFLVATRGGTLENSWRASQTMFRESKFFFRPHLGLRVRKQTEQTKAICNHPKPRGLFHFLPYKAKIKNSNTVNSLGITGLNSNPDQTIVFQSRRSCISIKAIILLRRLERREVLLLLAL